MVITGAASGIGEALACTFARHGARLLLADIDAQRLALLSTSLREQGVTCLTEVCDVSQEAALAQLADVAQNLLQGTDILINNAGVALVDSVQSLSLTDAHWLMNINFWGVVHGCRAFAPQMQSRPGTVIVNLSSVFAMVSLPTQSIYNASKAAVRAFSDALRQELRAHSDMTPQRHTVRVLCVHPGGIRTPLVERARMGNIDSLAQSPQALKAQFAHLARTSAHQAAKAIFKAVMGTKTRLLIGTDAKLGDLFYRLAPAHASAWFYELIQWWRNRSVQKNTSHG